MKKIFFLISLLCLVASCSFFSSNSEQEEELKPGDMKFKESKREEKTSSIAWMSIAGQAQWYKGLHQFRYVDTNGDYYAHPFYDLNPFFDYESLTMNFFVVNTAGTPHQYDFDLNSGRRFYRAQLCDRLDAWKAYTGVIDTPQFTEGIVPRTLDQLGRPLRILVFGMEDFYKEDYGLVSHQARIIGGVIRQFCRQVPCQGGIGQESNLILLAVDARDEHYRKIYNLEQLKEVIKWDYFKAYMENSDGVHFFEDKPYPLYRLSKEVRAAEAMKAATEKKLILQAKELESMRTHCLKLYDHFWEKVGSIKNLEKKEQVRTALQEMGASNISKTKVENENEKEKKLEANVVDVEVVRNRSPQERERLKRAINFQKEFINFFAQYGHEYGTCLKYVKHSDGSKNFNRAWFLAYTEVFFRLLEVGYIYDCDLQNWREEGLDPKRREQYIKSLRSCRLARFDSAFSRGITFMTHLRQSAKRHYRFIEYDDRAGGTHEKLFSWVRDEGKSLLCMNKAQSSGQSSDASVFPLDVDWVSF